MALGYDVLLRNARLNAITTYVGGTAKLRVYSGTKPATGAAIGGATLLAELTCNATFAPAASGGVLTLNAISDDSSADASGTPTWARIWKTDGTTACIDMTAGVGSGDLNFSAAIVAGGVVKCTSAAITDGTP